MQAATAIPDPVVVVVVGLKLSISLLRPVPEYRLRSVRPQAVLPHLEADQTPVRPVAAALQTCSQIQPVLPAAAETSVRPCGQVEAEALLPLRRAGAEVAAVVLLGQAAPEAMVAQAASRVPAATAVLRTAALLVAVQAVSGRFRLVLSAAAAPNMMLRMVAAVVAAAALGTGPTQARLLLARMVVSTAAGQAVVGKAMLVVLMVSVAQAVKA